MADKTVIDGEFSDDLTVEITGDEAPSKISSLHQRISDLEQENSTIVRENKEYQQRIKELKTSIKELSGESLDLKNQVDKAQLENKASAAVAARTAELETEVSRLQHDLVSAISDLEESNIEISHWKRDLESVKSREKEKESKLEAAETEKTALVAEVEKLVGIKNGLRVKLEVKDKEIDVLKNNVKELEMVVGNSKSLETLKNELDEKIVSMKGELHGLQSSLDEKEKMLSGFETSERAVLDGVSGGINGGGVVSGGKKGWIGGLEQRDWWLVAGGSAIAAMGGACYIHAARKH